MSELVAQAALALARLQLRNRCVLLDVRRERIDRIPEGNAVSLQVALERAMLLENLAILACVSERESIAEVREAIVECGPDRDLHAVARRIVDTED